VTFRIALDGMGGDYAPDEILRGAKEAVRDPIIELHLVGPETILLPKCRELNLSAKVHLHNAAEIVAMDELPSIAMRKRESSIAVGIRLLKENQVDAFVSAGNTGAVMALALLILGRLNDVKRPPLVVPLPGREGTVLLVDAGANVDCTPEQLWQYAHLTALFAQKVLNKPHPRVALLANGEEASKGNTLIKTTHALLLQSELNFIGNIEGKDLLGSVAEVVVADGFTGNIALKSMEGIATTMLTFLRDSIAHAGWRKLGGLFLAPVFRQLERHFDYNQVGAAPLLGVDGLVLIAHGRSKAEAILNAVRQAQVGINNHLVEALRKPLPSMERSTR
jgi:glycerol-3-phosphate acyltransferase PlsX